MSGRITQFPINPSAVTKPEYQTQLLFLDNRSEFAFSLVNYLRVYGYKLIRCSDFDQAITDLGNKKIDLVVMPDSLAGMHPIEMLRRIKNLVPDIPIVVVASRGDDQLAVDLLKSGADDYLSRKVKNQRLFVELPNVIADLVGNKQHQSAVAVEEYKNRDVVQETASLLLETSPLASCALNSNLQIIECNRHLAKLLGYSRQYLVGRSIAEFVPATIYQEMLKLNRQSCPPQDGKPVEIVVLRKDGEGVPVSCHIQNMDNDRLLVHIKDISEQMAQRAELEFTLYWQNLLQSHASRFINLPYRHFLSELAEFVERVAHIVDFFRCAVFLFDDAKSRATRVFLWQDENRGDLQELPTSCKLHPSAFDLKRLAKLPFVSLDSLVVDSKFQLSGHYMPIRDLYRKTPSLNCLLFPILIENKLHGWISFESDAIKKWSDEEIKQMSDVSSLTSQVLQRQNYEQVRRLTHRRLIETHGKLSTQASQDGLTGLANRRYFDRILESEIRRASRDQGLLSLLLVDIDYFKPYNDRYGHIKGDDCLKKVASAMQQHFQRAGDFVARFGGEEFAIILPGLNSAQAYEGAEKLRQRIENMRLEHHAAPLGRVTISVGAATLQAPGIDDLRDLLEAADAALYQAKTRGRNQVVSAQSKLPKQGRLLS